MKKLDTLDAGPSTLLIRNQDEENYKVHRQKVSGMESINKLGDGSHIHKINDSRTNFIQK